MIARVWSAHATRAQAPAYAEHLRSQVLPGIKRLDGYAGALLLEREVADEVEVVVVTLWRSLDAVRGFAGADVERAVVADEAAALLTRFDPRVHHYDLVFKDDVDPG